MTGNPNESERFAVPFVPEPHGRKLLLNLLRVSIVGLVILEYIWFLDWSRGQPVRPSSSDRRRILHSQFAVSEGSATSADPFDNRLGQHSPWPQFYAVSLIVFLYTSRWVILHQAKSRVRAIFWYAILALSTLPYIWLLVATDFSSQLLFSVSSARSLGHLVS